MEGSQTLAVQAVAAGQDQTDQKRTFNFSLVRQCDMSDELRGEAVDTGLLYFIGFNGIVVTAVEKFAGKYEAAAKNIKEQMDKRCGTSWHVVVGEGFGFEVTHEYKNSLYMFFGSLGVLVWKASN